jgi:hypothetical protein
MKAKIRNTMSEAFNKVVNEISLLNSYKEHCPKEGNTVLDSSCSLIMINDVVGASRDWLALARSGKEAVLREHRKTRR